MLKMIDHLRLQIPFDASHISCDADGNYFFLDFDIHLLDLNLASRSVYRNDKDEIVASHLFHPYESLPTNFTGVAMKVFFDSKIYPYVELKASPAKILQGHNIFGSDCIEQGALEMLLYLNEAYPTLYSMLYIPDTTVYHLDVTYSARFDNNNIATKVLDYLRNVENGHTKLSNKSFDTSVYWGGQQSRLLNLKCYLKYDEYIAQFEQIKEQAKKNDESAKRVLEVMQNPKLLEFCKGLLRFEARLKKRYLERLDIPTNLFALIQYQKEHPDFLQKLWQKATRNIFKALEGQSVKVFDDESILNAIRSSQVVRNSKGKISETRVRNLFSVYILIREKGLNEVKNNYSKASFYRLISDLILCGFSKAYLQNLHDNSKSNIIPFIKLVEFDFNKQLPDWYVPPVSRFVA